MNRKVYVKPATIVMALAHELLVVSNKVTDDGAKINTSTMEGGSGSDATKASGSWNLWGSDDE